MAANLCVDCLRMLKKACIPSKEYMPFHIERIILNAISDFYYIYVKKFECFIFK